MDLQISEEEIAFLTKGEDPYDDAVVRKLFHPNLKLLLVTEGPDGCRYYTKVSSTAMLLFAYEAPFLITSMHYPYHILQTGDQEMKLYIVL